MLLSTFPSRSRALALGAIAAALVSMLFSELIPSAAPFEESALNEHATNLTVVVTGANSGLGYGTVEHLARAGTARTVVLACRNHVKCETAKRKASSLLPKQSTTRLVTVPLDLASRSSIESFADSLSKHLAPRTANSDHDHDDLHNMQEPIIDVLINNAGIFATSAEHHYVDGVEEHMFVNYLGHVLSTHLLWPTLEASNARIVSVSSISALIPSNPLAGWYASDNEWSDKLATTSGLFRYFRSKRANLAFASELHRRVVSSGMVGVSSVSSHPGYTRSEIWSNGAKIFPESWAKLIESNPLFSMSSSDGALTQLWAALDRRQVPSGSYVGPRWWLHGKPIQLGTIAKPKFPFHHFPLSDAELLWQRTMEVLGIEEFGRPKTAILS